MQIVKINEKDIIDTIMLLREHEIAATTTPTTSTPRTIAKLCAERVGALAHHLA